MQDKPLSEESERPSQRVRQREDTRKRLLAAARKLFRKDGVDRVSMEEIATEASVSRATLYLHFPGKPSLLEALLLEDWAGQIRLFERLRAVDLSDSEQLSRWLMRVAEGMRLARDSFGIHRAALGQNPELTLKHQHHRTRLAELLLQAIAATGSRADLARAIEAELIVAEIEYFAIAAAIGWSADQFATALPLVTDRLRAFARSAG